MCVWHRRVVGESPIIIISGYLRDMDQHEDGVNLWILAGLLGALCVFFTCVVAGTRLVYHLGQTISPIATSFSIRATINPNDTVQFFVSYFKNSNFDDAAISITIEGGRKQCVFACVC